MKITFKKIFKYNLNKDKTYAFEYACKVLSQQIDPISLETGKYAPKSNIVFCSTLKRAEQCIARNRKIKIIKVGELYEIPFNLEKNCTKIRFNKEGSVVVRRVFKKLFIKDQLMKSRKLIFSEIKNLILLIKKSYPNEKVVVISHSFRLKCIQAYLETDGQIERYPRLINNYIKDNEKTFDFGEEFSVEI